jgi:hypothetical protein
MAPGLESEPMNSGPGARIPVNAPGHDEAGICGANFLPRKLCLPQRHDLRQDLPPRSAPRPAAKTCRQDLRQNLRQDLCASFTDHFRIAAAPIALQLPGRRRLSLALSNTVNARRRRLDLGQWGRLVACIKNEISLAIENYLCHEKFVVGRSGIRPS